MSTKRNLYQPATKKSSTSKETRKPLTQGRLVEKTSTTQKGPGQGPVVPQGVPVEPDPGQSSQQVGTTHSPNPDTLHGDSLLNPRRHTPHASFHDSPSAVRPSMSLELSDTDSDIHSSGTGILRGQHAGHPPGVVVVDALSQPRGLNDSEVDVRVGLIHSPAKVVCHSPGKGRPNSQGDSGRVVDARKVTVDQVPHRTVLEAAPDDLSHDSRTTPASSRAEGSYHADRSGDSVPRVKVSHVQFSDRLECSDLAAPESERLGGGVEALDSGRLGGGAEESDRLGGGAEESGVRDTSGSSSGSVGGVKQSLSASLERLSVSGERSGGGRPTPRATRPPPGHKVVAIKTAKVTAQITRDKKAGRVVASRYMQASGTGSVKGPMKATDRDILTRSRLSTTGSSDNVRRASSSAASTSLRHRASSSGGARKRSVTKKKTSDSSLSATPEARGGGALKASTPTADLTSLPAPGGVDLSAIAMPHLSAHSTMDSLVEDGSHGSSRDHVFLSDCRGAPPSNTSKRDSRAADPAGIRKSHSGTPLSTKKSSAVVSQKKLDMTYVRYLQWLYLDARIESAFKEQEQHALSQLSALWECNEAMRRKAAALDLEHLKLSHLTRLDDTLETQKAGLAPITRGLPTLDAQYRTVAQALDTTRHQMALRDIHVPGDEEGYEGTLTKALQESEYLLGELGTMTRDQAPGVAKVADSLHVAQATVEAELKKLSNCREMLAASETLVAQERSLQIQTLEGHPDAGTVTL